MVSNYMYGRNYIRVAIEICVLGIVLLAACAAVVGGVEIRGEVAQGPFLWDAYNFQAFFYDFMGDGKTELLNVSSITGRTIPAGSLIYETHTIPGNYRVFNNRGILVNGKSSYSIIRWHGKKFVAFNDNASKITELLLEQGNEVKILISGESFNMSEEYTLVPDQIDSANNKVRLNLLKGGIVINSSVVNSQTAWVVNKTKEGEVGPIFITYVDSIGSNSISIKYSWLVSDTISVVAIGQKYGNGNFTVDEATNSTLILKNNIDINLLKGRTINVTDRLKFRVADSDTIRYYPFWEFEQPGKYEVRGTVFNEPTQPSTIPSWNGRTFAGFYSDLKYDRWTETLILAPALAELSASRTIQKEQLWYNTTRKGVDFKVVEKESAGSVSKAGMTQYQVVGWQGEKWIAINDRTNKIAKLAFEMGTDDNKTLAKGENWSLGSGYELTVNEMDIRTLPKQVWFTLKKDGEVIDEGIGQAPLGSSTADKEKAIYYKQMTLLGESNTLLFTVYVNNISSNAVEFKYAWLIDASSAKEIKAGDRFGAFEVRSANWDDIKLSNENYISLSRNTEQPLLGDLKLKVADSDQLRFYLKKDEVIPDQSEPPSALSLLINNGDAYTNSPSVTLGISAGNATEMSFSDDNSTWSEWEPYSVTRQWKLSGEDGLKTVYFKVKNAAGIASPVSDTIILATPKKTFRNKVEIRGTVANEQDEKPMWDGHSFGAFYYDLKYYRTTETMNVARTLGEIAANSRTIHKEELWYNTTEKQIDFKAYENEAVLVDGRSSYSIVGWLGEKFVGIRGKTNKLARLVMEMGKEDVKTMMVDETWQLGSGYELKVNGIDARTFPRQVSFNLSKDGILIENGIGQAPASGSVTDKQKAVYIKTKTIQGESDALLFTVYVYTIFSGSASDMVQFKYAWLIDESSAREITIGDKYGVFEVRTANSDDITLSNENDVTLPRNTETTLMGNLKFRVADSDDLRFYPYVEYTTPGTYEIRGTVAVADWINNPVGGVSWDARSFAGFFYDLKYNRQTEVLNLLPTLTLLQMSRTIDKEQLWYNTTKIMVDFKAYEKEGVLIDNRQNYSLVGWQGEKWIGINGKANKLARLVFEMGTEDKKTLTTGEKWSLGSGYEMTINTINSSSSPKQVNFTIRKDGEIIDEGIGHAPEDSSVEQKQEAVYIKTKTMANESDALLFTLYIDNIFSNATSDIVQFKYAWLIDESSAKEIKAADRYGVFEVRMANDIDIKLSNENFVSLSKNTETTLIGEIKFKVADNDTLRFYPKVDYVIGVMEQGPLTSIVVSPSTDTLTVGRTRIFSAAAKDINNNSLAGINISWTSSNMTVGSIDPSNSITGTDGYASAAFAALASGTATVNAMNGSVAGNASVTVTIPAPLPTASISGYKINDTNGNGKWDAGEAGIQGWTITLRNAATGAVVGSNLTGADGSYQFMDLVNGSYNVTEEMRTGFNPTNAPFKLVTITGQNVMDLNFTNQLITDTELPVINTLILNTTSPITGQTILVWVNATDNIAVTSVKANGVPLTFQVENLWTGTIIAIEGTNSVNVSAGDAAGNTAWDNSTSYTATTTPSIDLISNPGFESGTSPWQFYTDGVGSFDAVSAGFEGNNAAKIVLKSGGTNIQLYQTGIRLEPNTTYRLSFAAYSTSGHDLKVNLIKHGSPYTNYGLAYTANLGTVWQAFSTEFTTKGFTGTVNDGRLMFNLEPFPGIYYIDNVRLEKVIVPGLPVIITQPGDQTTNIAQTSTFSVVATDTTPLTYQWQKNGVDLPGAANATYTTQPATLVDDGSTFRVVVTNSVGSVISDAATLTVRTTINLLINPGFESGTSPWLFYTDGIGSFGAVSPSLEGNNAAKVVLKTNGANIQLYQTGITLEPHTRYRLSFSAYSTSGHDLSVYLHKHASPYTNYGLSYTANLGRSWQSFTTEFNTTAGVVNDGRLRFWLAPFVTGGETYYIDDVRLEKVSVQDTTGPVHNINKDTHYMTIQAAIDDASPGDEIHVGSGTYFENVNVNKQLTLRGIGMPVVDAGGSGNAITLAADGITLEGFTATGCGDYPNAGIKVASSGNTLSSNNADSNNWSGIHLYYPSNNNTLNGNNASNNNIYGIFLDSSSNNVLRGNNASNNNLSGIFLYSSSNNMVIVNNALNDNFSGIFLDSSSNNVLSGNNASNSQFGISLFSSSNNTIYNNYFSNTNNALDSGNNIWNIPKTAGTNIIGGSYLGGNYWSDYAGIDIDGDGLGDTMLPYTSSGGIANGGDYLPLIPVSTPGAPDITSFSPTTSTVTNNEGESRTFSITVNQTVNISWLINGTQVKTNNSVTSASYTSTNAAQGTWNVTVIASNTNGNAMLKWDWNVASITTVGRVHNINKGTNYATIQAAIDDASPGDEIHVGSGTYFENVDVNKQLILRGINTGEGKPVVDAGGRNNNAFILRTGYITIEGFMVVNSGSGIVTFSNIDMIQNILTSSSNNKILNNTFMNCSFGIILSNSGSNIVDNNTINHNDYGIYIWSDYNFESNNNTLIKNIMLGNNRSFVIEGDSISDFDNLIGTSNMVDGKSLYYIRNSENVIYNSSINAGTFYCISCINVLIKDIRINDGIFFIYTTNSRIQNVTCSNNAYTGTEPQRYNGISLFNSDNNTIIGNNASNNGFGISLFESKNNTLSDNNASNNGFGIILRLFSQDNMINGNNVINNENGMFIVESYRNTLEWNTVSSNSGSGITLSSSHYNVLTGNNVSNNTNGLSLIYYSSTNTIYNNYFRNIHNALDDRNNIWNITKTQGTNIIGGSYLGGNYWSDYAGIDTDGDGLGDTILPYTSSGGIANGGDYLPLTQVI